MTGTINLTPSNTIITIPTQALYPSDGLFFPLLIANTARDLFIDISLYGRSGVFVNPVASEIANTSNTANIVYSIINSSSSLSNTDKTTLLSIIINPGLSSGPGSITFSEQLANASFVDVVYTNEDSIQISDTVFVNVPNTTIVSLTASPTNNPIVFVNSVYQSNSGYTVSRTSSGSDATDLLSALVNLTDHTNRISGITDATELDEVSLDRILSLGIALNTLTNAIDGLDTNYNANNVMYCMSALFCTDLLTSYRNTLLNDIVVSINGNVSNVVLITTQLTQMKDDLNNIINADEDYFGQVDSFVRNQSLAAFIQNMFSEASGKYLINEQVGTDRLKEILTANTTD